MNQTLESPTGAAARRPFWVWVGLALLAAGAVFYLRSTPRQPPQDRGPGNPGVGAELASLQFEPLTGEAPPIGSEDLRGNVALINFWGPWCHFCKQEMPHLLEMKGELAERDDFRLLLVSYGAGPSDNIDQLRRETAQYMEQLQSGAATYHDPQARNLRVLAEKAQLSSIGFPITVVLDREGVIRGLWLGYQPGEIDDMEKLVTRLLDSPA